MALMIWRLGTAAEMAARILAWSSEEALWRLATMAAMASALAASVVLLADIVVGRKAGRSCVVVGSIKSVIMVSCFSSADFRVSLGEVRRNW